MVMATAKGNQIVLPVKTLHLSDPTVPCHIWAPNGSTPEGVVRNWDDLDPLRFGPISAV